MPVAAVIAPTPTVASDMRDDVSGHSPTYTRAATADPISNAAPRDGRADAAITAAITTVTPTSS